MATPFPLEAPPTATDLATGDRSTIPEESAWASFLELRENRPDLDQPAGSDGTTTKRALLQGNLRGYVDERRKYGHPIFPTETAKAARARAEFHRGLFTKPLDEALPPENYARIEARAKDHRDPDKYRARMLLKSYFGDVFGSKVKAEDFDRFRVHYARQHLGMTGTPGDKEVFAALRDRFTGEADADKVLDLARRDLFARTFEAAAGRSAAPATTSATLRTPGEFDQTVQVPVTEPAPLVDVSAEWQKIRDTFPDYARDRAREAFYKDHREALRVARRINTAATPIEKQLRFITDYTREQSGEFGALNELWAKAASLMPDDPADRALVLRALELRMQAWPKDERGILERAFTEAERGTERFIRGGADWLRGMGAQNTETLAQIPLVGPMLDGDLEARREGQNYTDKLRALQDLTYQKGGSNISPYDNFIERGAILTGGSAPYIAASFSPAGMAVSAFSFAGQNYSQARRETIEGPPLEGIGNQEAATRTLRGNQFGMATLSGSVEAGIERATTVLGMKWLKGKFPTVAGLMTRAGITNPPTRAAVGGIATGAGIAAVEYSEEVAQASSNRFTQDLALRLSKLQPSTDWGKFYADWSPATQQGRNTLAAVSIFGLIGAGGASFSHFKNGQQLREDAALMRAMGFKEDTVKTVLSAEDPRVAEKAVRDAFAEGLEPVAPNQRQAYLDTLEAEQKAWAAVGWGNVESSVNSFTDEEEHTFTPPDGSPALRFDNRADALMAWRDWALRDHDAAFDLIQEAAKSETIDFLTGEGQASESTRIEEKPLRLTPGESVRQGYATPAQLQARLESFAIQEGKSVEEAAKDFDSLVIRARRFSEIARDGTTRYIVQLFEGSDPLNVLEDLAEDAWVRALDQRLTTPEQLEGWIRETEQATGNAYLKPGYVHDPAAPLPLLEALSGISREYALDQVKNSDRLPAAFRRWLDMLIGLASATLGAAREIARRMGRGADLRKAFEEGRLSPEFRAMVEDSIGLNTKATEARLKQRMEEELAADAMQGFPEIAAALRGQLPHPDTVKANRGPLAGELRRIFDGLKTPTRRRRKDGSAIDSSNAANAYFLPVGEMVDLDDVRARMNARGFDFLTPADMLDALDSSLNYSRPIYGTRTAESSEPSFALSSDLRTLFPNAPESYTFQTSDEARPRILEIARANGIELVSPPPDLLAGAGSLGEALGVEVLFYRGGDARLAGFTPRGNPELLFLNSAPAAKGIPLSWTFAHELTHAAQKDPAAGAGEFGAALRALLTPEELAGIEAELSALGYAPGDHSTELPAYLAGDAISGRSAFGLDQLAKAAEIETLAADYFDALSRLRPDSLPGATDEELAAPRGDASFSFGQTPAFYSQLERTVAAKVPDNAPPAQILATVDPSRGTGVKAEEIKWSGLALALDRLAAENGGKVPKDALLAYLRDAGAIRFIETVAADGTQPEVTMQDGGYALFDRGEFVEWYETREEADSAMATLAAVQGPDAPKFKAYKLPGGDNYREVILSMPSEGKSFERLQAELSELGYSAYEDDGWRLQNAAGEDVDRSRAMPRAWEILQQLRGTGGEPETDSHYTSSHFPKVPNYVAHMRLTDRTDGTGARGLFLEEVQSDRHQQGREKGYIDPEASADMSALAREEIANAERLVALRRLSSERALTDEEKAEWTRLQEETSEIRDRIIDANRKPGVTGIPDAPFRKDWPLQMFKRALRDAVAAGVEWIGWTTGKTQADRFDLSKQIDTIEYRPETRRLEAFRDGYLVIDTQVAPDGLADVIGKEAAAKLMGTEPQASSSGSGIKVHRLEGESLRVGGNGMKAFYDAILPTEIGRYVKKWGATVEDGTAITSAKSFEVFADQHRRAYPDATEEQTRAAFARHTGTPIHRVSITPAMREGVAQGQASFAIGAKGLARLEEAIARKMTEGPAERAEFYQRMRDRLAGLLQRYQDADAGIGPFARKPSEDAATMERRRISEAMAEAQTILSAFPPEVRGRVSIPTAELLSNTSERGKVNAFKRLIDDADEALEIHLRKEYAEAIDTLFDMAKPSLGPSKQLAGKLTPETQRKVDKALTAALLTEAQLASEIVGLEARIAAMEDGRDAANPPGSAGHLEALEDHDFLELFGAVNSRSAAEMETAYEQLLALYTKGRTARRVLEEAKRKDLDDQKRQILETLGRPSQPEHSKRTEDAGTGDFLEAFRLGVSSFHQVMESLFPGSPVAARFQEMVRKAERTYTRATLDATRRFETFMGSAFNATTKRQRDAILAKLSKRRDDWNIELREGTRFEEQKLTPEQAAAVLDGSIKPGWHTDPIAMESLRQALADFRLARRKDKSRAKLVRFQRLTNRGAAAWMHMSDLEALYVLQLAAQSEYLPALDRYGFTKPVLEAIAKKIDPRATRIGDHLAREYDAGYHRLNPVFRELYGFDMPRIRNYAPGLFDHAQGKTEGPQDAFGGTNSPVNAMSTGLTKSRQHHMARPRQANALAAYWAHVSQMEYFTAYGPTLREMRAVFRNPDVRRAIEGTRGTRVAHLFSQWLDALEVDGRFQATNLLTVSEVSANALAAQSAIGLAFNVGTLLKQVSAVTGTLYTMPFRDYVKGLVGVLRDPASLKPLWETETIRQRIERGFSPEDRQLLDASRAKPSLILDLLNVGRLPIAWVDAALSTVSGSIAYKFHLQEAQKAGLSARAAEEFALEQFDRAVLQTAQPATTQDKSMAELTATNAVARAMILFKSDPRQKVALAWETLSQLGKGKIGKTEAARKILVGWVLYGVIAQAASDIWLSISRDDERPDLWDWKKYLASALAGPVSGLVYFGTAIDFGIRKLLTGRAYTNNPSPIDAALEGALRLRFVDTIQTLTEGEDVTASDIMNAIVADSRAFALIAGAKDPRFAAAAVVPRMIRDAAGLVGNTIDLFSKSDAEMKRAILAEAGEASKETREQATEDRKDQLKGFLRASPEEQERRLRALDTTDRRTATRYRQERALRQLEPEDRQLGRLDPETRLATVRKFLAIMPPPERPAYLDRLRAAGILSQDAARELAE